MEALSDGHTVAPLMKVGYLHARRGAKTYLFHFGYQTKDSEYPQVSFAFISFAYYNYYKYKHIYITTFIINIICVA